jgi:hypothetical protein
MTVELNIAITFLQLLFAPDYEKKMIQDMSYDNKTSDCLKSLIIRAFFVKNGKK